MLKLTFCECCCFEVFLHKYAVYSLINYTPYIAEAKHCLYCIVYVAVFRALAVTMHLNGGNNSPVIACPGGGGSGPHLTLVPWAHPGFHLKCRNMDMLLLQSTNWQCHMAYWFMPFPITWNDLDVICLLKGFPTNVCATFHTVSTDNVAQSLVDRCASCYTVVPQLTVCQLTISMMHVLAMMLSFD